MVYDLCIKKRKLYAALLGGVIIVFLMSLPIKSLMAESKYSAAVKVIDDKETEHLDMLSISEESMDNYTRAIALIEEARSYLPMKSDYASREARLYVMLGVWGETLLSLEESLPEGFIEPSIAYARAEELLAKAATLEPTNADYHLAIAGLYDIMKNTLQVDIALRRVVAAYPRNAPLRYLVAMRYLLSDMPGSALEHARVLADIDDGYLPWVVKEGSEAQRLSREDIRRFRKSYLFAAFEIAWRVSEDRDVVLGIAPDNVYAEEVVELFFDWRGDWRGES